MPGLPDFARLKPIEAARAAASVKVDVQGLPELFRALEAVDPERLRKVQWPAGIVRDVAVLALRGVDDTPRLDAMLKRQLEWLESLADPAAAADWANAMPDRIWGRIFDLLRGRRADASPAWEAMRRAVWEVPEPLASAPGEELAAAFRSALDRMVFSAARRLVQRTRWRPEQARAFVAALDARRLAWVVDTLTEAGEFDSEPLEPNDHVRVLMEAIGGDATQATAFVASLGPHDLRSDTVVALRRAPAMRDAFHARIANDADFAARAAHQVIQFAPDDRMDELPLFSDDLIASVTTQMCDGVISVDWTLRKLEQLLRSLPPERRDRIAWAPKVLEFRAILFGGERSAPALRRHLAEDFVRYMRGPIPFDRTNEADICRSEFMRIPDTLKDVAIEALEQLSVPGNELDGSVEGVPVSTWARRTLEILPERIERTPQGWVRRP